MKQPYPINESPMAGGTLRKATPALSQVITGLMSAAGGKAVPTLDEVRAALQSTGTTWSPDGELLFPQDRTALVIEVDEFIDAYGAGASAAAFVATLGPA